MENITSNLGILHLVNLVNSGIGLKVSAVSNLFEFDNLNEGSQFETVFRQFLVQLFESISSL
jgi:hypothetical protein